MQIEIPDEIAEQIGIKNISAESIVIETVDLGERTPVEVTGSQYPSGILIYVKE